MKIRLFRRRRNNESGNEMLRKIDNLAETAKTFGKMEIVRKMKQIVPECKSKKSGDEGIDGVGTMVNEGLSIWENNTSKA